MALHLCCIHCSDQDSEKLSTSAIWSSIQFCTSQHKVLFESLPSIPLPQTPQLHQKTEKNGQKMSFLIFIFFRTRVILESLNSCGVSRKVCNALLYCLQFLVHEEMSFTFQLSLIWCAFLYKCLSLIHTPWKFLEGKKLTDFEPSLIYTTA